MTCECCVCAGCCTRLPGFWWRVEKCLFVVMVELSVSFCLSDGCEGHSLLAVSQNGLSLSLASLFSGICRLGRFHKYMHVNCVLWQCYPEEKLMAPLNTQWHALTTAYYKVCCCHLCGSSGEQLRFSGSLELSLTLSLSALEPTCFSAAVGPACFYWFSV